MKPNNEDCNAFSYQFYLTIANHTEFDLKCGKSQLIHGVWRRDSVAGTGPCSVRSGETKQVVGCRGVRGTWSGYKITCNWFIDDQTVTGSMTLNVSVPFSGKTRSSLNTTGFLNVENWNNLPKKGHYFDKYIDVYLVGDELVGNIRDRQNIIEDYSIEDYSIEERDYDNLLLENRDTIMDWDKVETNIPMCERFDPMTKIPSTYLYPPKEMFFGRSGAHIIDKMLWKEIEDPVFSKEYMKNLMVDSYFSVGIYSRNTNPRATASIAAGMKVAKETTVEVVSAIISTIETAASIRALIGTEYKGLKAELETTYSISNIREESNSKLERETKSIEIEASTKNRLFVPWVFSTAVAIYRKRRNGVIELIGISEWATEILDKIYDYE